MNALDQASPPVSGTGSVNDIPPSCRLETYDYDLPQELIAQEPAALRDMSGLMVIRRNSRQISRHVFRDLPDLLSSGDLVVINETAVVPAALTGKKPTGGRVELLVLEPTACSGGTDEQEAVRVCLVRSSKPIRPGTRVEIAPGVELIALDSIAPGRVRFRFPAPEQRLGRFLDSHGRAPLPPYIKSEGRDAGRDRTRYQTVYASTLGSVAAPTAGLHFTEDVLDRLGKRGIEVARVVLHVGPGTFLPVRVNDIRAHTMEEEWYEIPEAAAHQISCAVEENRRIVAVGTTTVRALESAADSTGHILPGKGETRLFIRPGHSFRVAKALVTNFHLPRSTLLMLACAFGGIGLVLEAYRLAVENRYRFYSYGDACLIMD